MVFIRPPHCREPQMSPWSVGDAYSQPGEISLSPNGVLFLDELPEFKRGVLEIIQQPLEDREATISRARFMVTYSCSFILVAIMNPSPGGYFNNPDAPSEIQLYLVRIYTITN